MAHVTDWLPTLLEFGGCRGLDYGGKPLDGISLASAIFDQSENEVFQPREEILHFMNPLSNSDRTDSRLGLPRAVKRGPRLKSQFQGVTS